MPKLLLAPFLWAFACGGAPQAAAPPAPVVAPLAETSPFAPPEMLTARVVATYPHRTDAFTQGLLYAHGHLYESTGLEGRSSLREVELATGRVLRQKALAPRIFAEGLALGGDDRLVQLSWKNGKVFFWDRATFAPRGELDIAGEGWGLTSDGSRLILSDGSSTLSFRDPRSLAELGRLEVQLEGRPVDDLNELEWVDGAIWANVWQRDEIVRIDPATGRVSAVVDLSGLLTPAERAGTDVLNGIAHRADAGTFLITGKLWPKLFEVVFE